MVIVVGERRGRRRRGVGITAVDGCTYMVHEWADKGSGLCVCAVLGNFPMRCVCARLDPFSLMLALLRLRRVPFLNSRSAVGRFDLLTSEAVGLLHTGCSWRHTHRTSAGGMTIQSVFFLEEGRDRRRYHTDIAGKLI